MNNNTDAFSNNPNLLPHIVAKLFYEDELDPGQISYLIGVSRHVVGKILSEARVSKIVKIEIQPFNSRNSIIEKALISKYSLKDAFVLQTEGFNTESTRRVVGYFASKFASDLIRSHMIVGVGGGRCLAELISRINPGSGIFGIIATQIMGTYSSLITNIESYELAYSLSKKYLGTHYTAESSIYYPNIASLVHERQKNRTAAMTSYFNKIQLAFIGIGSLNDLYISDRNTLSNEEITTLANNQAIGEIAGRFFNKQGIECNSPLRDCTLSISLEELRKINDIVLTAVGRRKSEAIHFAAKNQLFNILITDSLTANNVLELN